MIWASVLLSRSVPVPKSTRPPWYPTVLLPKARLCSSFSSCPPARLRLANTEFQVPILCFHSRELPNTTTSPLPVLEVPSVTFVVLSPVYNVQHVQRAQAVRTNQLIYVIDTMAVEGPGELAASGRRV